MAGAAVASAFQPESFRARLAVAGQKAGSPFWPVRAGQVPFGRSLCCCCGFNHPDPRNPSIEIHLGDCVEGMARRENTTVFVSRGIGTIGVPVRINCPPEVAVLTLSRHVVTPV